MQIISKHSHSDTNHLRDIFPPTNNSRQCTAKSILAGFNQSVNWIDSGVHRIVMESAAFSSFSAHNNSRPVNCTCCEVVQQCTYYAHNTPTHSALLSQQQQTVMHPQHRSALTLHCTRIDSAIAVWTVRCILCWTKQCHCFVNSEPALHPVP